MTKKAILRFLTLIITILGFSLIVLSQQGYPEFTQTGYALVYMVCGLLMIDLIRSKLVQNQYGVE